MTRRLFGLFAAIGLIRLIVSGDQVVARLSTNPHNAQAPSSILGIPPRRAPEEVQGPVLITNKEAGPFGPASQRTSSGYPPSD